MFKVKLRNNESFSCGKDTTILSAAKENGIILEHSCLSARCRSCIVKIVHGQTFNLQDEFVLSEIEKAEGYVLSCNSVPLTDLEIEAEDIGRYMLPPIKTLPAKIDSLEFLSDKILKVILRLPPNSSFEYVPGQYVNIIKTGTKRSYSIANSFHKDSKLEFFIKKYEDGVMSKYWFENAKFNDLLQIVGPYGTFFYRDSLKKNIIFLATGTGIAPVKAILEQIVENSKNILSKKILVIWGNRDEVDLIWKPDFLLSNIEFINVLSRGDELWNGERGYVQDVLLTKNVDMTDAQIYACGSTQMINTLKNIVIKNGLYESEFYSDEFVSTN